MLNTGLLFAANVTPENIEWGSFSRFMLLAVLDIAIMFDGPGWAQQLQLFHLLKQYCFQ